MSVKPVEVSCSTLICQYIDLQGWSAPWWPEFETAEYGPD